MKTLKNNTIYSLEVNFKMGNLNRTIFLLLILFVFSSVHAFGQLQTEENSQTEINWSSVDDVFNKKEINKLVKKHMSGPIKIGFTAKEVQAVMGVPDQIDEENNIFYYRYSPIFFNDEWEVQSWDNRYGNLNVLKEVKEISLGSHILEVFEEKGIPIRITRIDNSYQLEYPDEMIYIGESWHVEAMHPLNIIVFQKSRRESMSIDEFLKEFESHLKKKPTLVE